jgi:hypothetical protein
MAVSNKLKVNELIDLMVNYVSAVKTPSQVNPIMLWGSPGVGKSQAMKQVGELLEEKLKKHVVVTDVRLLLFNPVDLRGIPVANDDKTLAVWLKPQIFQMDTNPDILNILILDEISAAPPSVQAAAYQIVLDRQIGEHKIPDNCLILCAGNQVTDKSVAYKMPKALANRLSHIEIQVDLDDWKKWAIPKEVDERIVGYLNFQNGKLYDFQPNSDDNAFPTPRSWEKVDNVLKFLKLDQAMPIISGHIGEATAFDFLTYTKVYSELPDIDLIIAGKCKEVKKRPDINFAVVSSLVSRSVKADDKQLDNIMEYGLLLESEFAVLLFKDLVKSVKELGPRMAKSPAFLKFLGKYKYLIQDSK